MSSSPLVKAAVLAFLCIANLAPASVELAGACVGSTDSCFLLADKTAGVTSPWLKIGDSFQGYLVVSFDAKSEVLDVKSGALTLHLKLRSPEKTLPAPPTPLGEKEQRAADQRAWQLSTFFAYDNVFLADVTVNGSFAYITPREVFKGSDFPAGAPIRIPHQFGFGGYSGGTGSYVMGFSSKDPFNNPFSYTGSGGVHLDDFRAYKNGANQLPDPTSPSVTPAAGAAGAPSVAADH
jgi:hypothetical protein